MRERVAVQLPPPIAMPAHLGPWARSADIRAIPDASAMAVRRYLDAQLSMAPDARQRLGQELVTEVLEYVAPWPPAGSSAQEVMAAVLATRRDRDAARLAREDELRRSLLAPGR